MNSHSPTERRQPDKQSASALKRVMNGLQAETLHTIEQFGWNIQFLRPQSGGEVLAVVFDPDSRAHAIIEPDGTLVKNPAMQFR